MIIDTELKFKLAELQEAWRSDPLLCAYTLFLSPSQKLTREQQKILESVFFNQKTFVRSGHGQGKTWISSLTTLCFLFSFYPSKVITTAPSWSQVELLLWSEIRNLWKNAKIQKFFPLGPSSPLKTKLELDENWFAIGISPRIDTDDPGHRMTGFHSEHMLFVGDEGPGLNPKIWEMKNTLLTSQFCRELFIGNPVDSSGPFYIEFQNTNNSRIKLNIFDSPNFKENGIDSIDALNRLRDMPGDEQEQAYAKMVYPFPSLVTPRWAVDRLVAWGADNPIFQSRVLAEFPTQSEKSLISLYSLELCKQLEHANLGQSASILGVDVARFGDDDTVFFGMKHWKEFMRDRVHGWETTRVVENVLRLNRKYSFGIIVVDEGGLGAGVVDQLRLVFEHDQRGPKILGVNFGGKCTNKYSDQCNNMTAELFMRLSNLLKKEEIFIEDKGKLFGQLLGRKYSTDEKNRIKIEPKDVYKKRTGQGSPDEADALLLCIYGLTIGQTSCDVNTSEEKNINDW